MKIHSGEGSLVGRLLGVPHTECQKKPQEKHWKK